MIRVFQQHKEAPCGQDRVSKEGGGRQETRDGVRPCRAWWLSSLDFIPGVIGSHRGF